MLRCYIVSSSTLNFILHARVLFPLCLPTRTKRIRANYVGSIAMTSTGRRMFKHCNQTPVFLRKFGKIFTGNKDFCVVHSYMITFFVQNWYFNLRRLDVIKRFYMRRCAPIAVVRSQCQVVESVFYMIWIYLASEIFFFFHHSPDRNNSK
jgi:hypothetical protein